MAVSGNHPDIIEVNPDEKGKIGIDAVHDLQHQLQYRTFEAASRRVVIVSDIHTMTIPAQNALLKTLEEPPAGTTMIVTAISPVAVLETIASRCRPIYLAPVTAHEIEAHLVEHAGIPSANAAEIAGLSHGLIGKALTLAADVEAVERHQAMENQVTQLAAAPNLFDRLLAAGQIAQQSAEIGRSVELLTTWIRTQARQEGSLQASNLATLERLRLRLAANVSPKTAFEAFAAEVAC
jgi:DNA polymerase-3 subunit delta'